MIKRDCNPLITGRLQKPSVVGDVGFVGDKAAQLRREECRDSKREGRVVGCQLLLAQDGLEGGVDPGDPKGGRRGSGRGIRR